ncbi:MAG: imidazolonepropionase, partial [Deltaproteobacteria bacterium]|nr:imidazolonepropionase [Deltaproteobacteria bacterium]
KTRKLKDEMKDLEEIQNAYLVVKEGRIATLGTMSQVPHLSQFQESVDCKDRLVLPGFVDSHTHLLYVGNRANEFEMRSQGKSYEEIAQAGGGIKKSVGQTKNCSEDQLVCETFPRLQEMLSHGTTTVEIKSGYGLSLDSELKMLRAIRRLKERSPLEIHATFLGAHDIPRGISRKAYIDEVTQKMIPQVAKERLAEFCDIFCDRGYFSPEETRTIALAAREKGLKIKIHANELGNTGGAEIACEVGAVSVDHLLFLENPQMDALKRSQVVCTLLPGTSFFLRMPYAPVRRLIDGGMTVALATDSNPGSCTATSMPLIQNIATTQMGMCPSESLVASTLHGAAALGIEDRVGSITVGKDADLIVTAPMQEYREIAYRLGQNPCWRVYKHGKLVFENPAGLR